METDIADGMESVRTTIDNRHFVNVIDLCAVRSRSFNNKYDAVFSQFH